MAPSGRTRRRRTSRTTHCRRQLFQYSSKTKQEADDPLEFPKCHSSSANYSSSSSNTCEIKPSKIEGSKEENCMDLGSNNDCSTPKAQRFRIPEILTCPPAPKKRRVISNCSSEKSSSVPISFFAPPDIELFFYFALQNISA